MEKINSKILLFGEYAVLHNGMALVIPCDKFSGSLAFPSNSNASSSTEQSNEYLKKFCSFVSSHMDEQFVLEVKRFEKELEQGLFFKSNIPQGYGLGSSGALVVAITLRYLVKAKLLKDDLKEITFQRLKELKKSLGKLESHFHGISSGLDPLSILLNEPILYKGPQDIVKTKLPHPTKEKKNVVFLLDTKYPRTTTEMMRVFKRLHKKEAFKQKFKQNILENNNQAVREFLDGKVSSFYNTMHNLTSFQLQYMKDFFPEEIQKEVAKGLDNGGYFLKICGAGGGGFILGFTENWEKTNQLLTNYTLKEIYRY